MDKWQPVPYSRRQFLRLSAVAGVGLVVPPLLGFGCGSEEGQPPAGTITETQTIQEKVTRPLSQIDRYIDPLPVPDTLAPETERYPDTDYYEIRMSQFEQQLHSQLPRTAVWGYGGSFPGPTIEARRGRKTRIKWINDDLPGTHLLQQAIDPTIYQGREYPDVRTITHMHGCFVAPEADGQPDAWSTPGGSQTGPRHYGNEFTYPNDQPATMLWYHDHAMHITRLNVYAGLSGLYIIRDEEEDNLELPSGEYEIPLIIQDRFLTEEGLLTYPTNGTTPIHPIWVLHIFGDTPVINGSIYPFLDAEPRRYRLRLLNGSNARTWNLWFEKTGTPGNNGVGSVHPVSAIGTDGGLLPVPVQLEKVRLAPAERADIILDLTGFEKGTVLTLRNDARAAYPFGEEIILDNLMQVRVNRDIKGVDNTTKAERLNLPDMPVITSTPGLPKRIFFLGEQNDPEYGVIGWLINERFFHDPVEETPRAGTTEIWEIVNFTLDAHPFHIHLVQFQVLNRQPFDQWGYWYAYQDYLAESAPIMGPDDFLTGPAVPPPPEEAGWKDTALSMPGEVLRLVVPFNVPEGVEGPARYIYHCHMLEHEDNDMMRPFDVLQ